MRPDPVVEEVRRVGEQIAAECGYDLHTLVERLREAQKRDPGRKVIREPLPRPLRLSEELR